MKRIIIALALLACMPIAAQTDWKKIDKLMEAGSPKSAYTQAEAVFKKTKSSTDLLTAAWYMARAAAEYQEDYIDSAEARYRAILPRLDAVERAVCYAFLGEADSALMDEELLKQTPAIRLAPFCEKGDRKGLNLTPTAFDVVARAVIGHYDDRNKREALLKKLVALHESDDDAIRIDLDMQLLNLWGENEPSMGDGHIIQRYINKYRGSKCPMVADLFCRMASWLESRDRLPEAVRYCDTAIALFPKSEGAAACADIRNAIVARHLAFGLNADEFVVYPGRPSLCKVDYKNLGRIHFSLYPYDGSAFRGFINNSPKPLKRWTVDVVDDGTHHQQSALFDLPPLAVGNYILVATTDGKEDENSARIAFDCCDFLLNVNGDIFQMVDAVSGEPISGQQVVGIDYRDHRDTAVTDADGCFRFAKNNLFSRSRLSLRIRRGGYTYQRNTWFDRREVKERISSKLHPLADRPIYRPGDTVHLAAILYECDGLDGRTLAGREVSFSVNDPNGKQRACLQATTDAHGVVSATYVLPVDGLAGGWYVWVRGAGISQYMHLRVEEYKQPKFMVSLDDPSLAAIDEAPVFGRPVTIRGRATAYSGASLSGAKVKYRVVRQAYWRWNWFEPVEMGSDSTVASVDGTFDISFVPQPDTNSDLSRRPTFQFGIFVDVTDLNGETHSASTFLAIGRENVRLQLDAMQPNVRSLREVGFSYTDLSGRPVKGKVSVNVMRLIPSDTLRLEHPLIKNNPDALMTLSRDEFRRLFPGYAYSAEEVNYHNAERDFQYVTIARTDGTSVRTAIRLDDKHLPSGIYCIVVSDGTVSDTIHTIVLTLPDERQTVADELLWADVDTLSVLPGGRLTLRYGSAYEGSRFYYTLSGPNGELRDVRWLPADRRIKSLSIPVDSTLLGGFYVHLVAVCRGVKEEWRSHIDVPFDHKKLHVDIATFRDKLQPGDQEEWTIRVESGNRKEQSDASSIIMTMFDDALSSYGSTDYWYLRPWRGAYGRPFYWVDKSLYNNGYYEPLPGLGSTAFHTYEYILLGGLVGEYGLFYPYRRMYKNSAVAEVTTCLEVADAAEPAAARGAYVKNSLQGNVRARTASKASVLQTSEEEEAILATGMDDAASGQPEVQLRTNLNTLAFFVTDLSTDSTGTATYRFRVPELLTRWSIKGLAFTDDLKIGTLDKSLVTQKSLMVQPNIPRFLRHGDSLVLMAKVVNLTDNDRQVKVMFNLSNQNIPIILKKQLVAVSAQGSAQVTFPIADLPTDLYVATYEITAQTIDENDLPQLSDGERGQIPVVSSRQAVTLSQPIYINGIGEKNFTFHLSPLTATAEPHFLGAELVANPIWLAVKAMPYLKETENPSNLYLANQLYVNTLGQGILKNLKGLKDLNALADTSNTSLKINEDVKQTLLEATPWLRDAESEVEQRQAIAHYFDSTRMSEELEKIQSQLAARQNGDGGWSWMPDGESSLWVTEQILKRVVQASSLQISKALTYVDREEQRHYEKYIKPYLKKGYKWAPDNIDYLYTRSFYGKGKTEAYKFYYNNALKNYKNYTGLYSQAQLALIFQRHGNKQAARDIIRRLKEKSLESDEMGMYWRDNRGGWCWYERPVETQALLIQAFAEITPADTATIALMQQWLLKQKQANHWGNDRATVEAIRALMIQNNQIAPSNPNNQIAMKACGAELTAPTEGLEGYRTQRWAGPALDSIIALNDSTITLRKETPGIAWGAVYFQYTDDMDKIPASESGITLKRTYLYMNNQEAPKVGDRVRVRIEISCDRTMEYLELIDGRPSCVEPVSTRSGWCWSQGLSYYVEVKNTATHCYINRLEKGKYVVEYDVFVTNPGTFLAGPVTMQCMYAPEFRATAPGECLVIR